MSRDAHPGSHILLQSTHTHNGPDDIGVWGSVPSSYLAYVKAQTEAAIRRAVAAERPASCAGRRRTCPGSHGRLERHDDSDTGDNLDYPPDNQMRVLQALTPRRRVIVTLVNYSTHPTVYGPLNKVSPDWPGATATFLEHDEIGIPSRVRYGYPGSIAVVTVGALGHTWPATAPRGTDPAVDPSPKSDNGPADDFGNAVARMAISAVSRRPGYLRSSDVAGTSRNVQIVNDNAVLLVAGSRARQPLAARRLQDHARRHPALGLRRRLRRSDGGAADREHALLLRARRAVPVPP